jgi:hypothetical protein
MSKLKRYQLVRVKGEKRGSINEYARVCAVYDDGTIWIANLNMPFIGTISKIVTDQEIEPIEAME